MFGAQFAFPVEDETQNTNGSKMVGIGLPFHNLKRNLPPTRVFGAENKTFEDKKEENEKMFLSIWASI